MSKSHTSDNWAHQWATYRRLIAYAKPYTARLLWGSVFGVLFGSMSMGGLVGLNSLLGNVFANATFSQVVLAAICLPLLAMGRGVGQFFSEYFIQWVGNRVVMDLRIQTFTHLQDLSVRFFSQSKTGELISRTINDSMMLERAVAEVLRDLIKEPFVLIGAVGYAVYLDYRLALASFVLFPICIVPVALFGRRVRRYARQGQERLATLVAIMQETMVGIRIVKAFGMESYEASRFATECRMFFDRVMRVTRARASVEPMIVVISAVGVSLVMLYAHWVNMKPADFITFVAAMVLLYEPVKKISKLYSQIQQSSASAERIFEMLDTPVSIKDAPGAVELKGPVQKVSFENVSFCYSDKAMVLNDVSVTVRAGERLAIVGGSGAGKTTLVNLMPRFYDVTSGRVTVNDVDIRNSTLKSLRQLIGMVTQDTFLFNDSVTANISYGFEHASRPAIEEAARRAHAHEFIMKMPQGYDTVIGERGTRLSGGQSQRLAIARAILRNPPILILDEATSALDTESERLVQEALDDLMKGRTVLAIAHRLSTIMHCNNIIVLEHGRIVESGTHAQLLETGGLYRRLYNMQFNMATDTTM